LLLGLKRNRISNSLRFALIASIQSQSFLGGPVAQRLEQPRLVGVGLGFNSLGRYRKRITKSAE